MVDLKGKKILITGASSGIGRATAILAAKLGANLIICGRDEKRLDETLNSLENNFKHKKYAFDLRNFDEYEKLFKFAVSDGVKLDGLFHSAGIAPYTPIRTLDYNMVSDILSVNLTSFLMLMRYYGLKSYSNGGSALAVSSVNAHYPMRCMSAYAASKAGLEAAVKTLAFELSKRNIRVNCIILGPVNTPMGNTMLDTSNEYVSKKMLFDIIEPEEVAKTVAFYLSDGSSKTTGRTIFLDGGYLGQ